MEGPRITAEPFPPLGMATQEETDPAQNPLGASHDRDDINRAARVNGMTAVTIRF